FGHAGGGLLHLAHQGAHARTRAVAGGEDEIGHPDLSVQRFLIERTAGFVGQRKTWDLSIDGQRRLLREASGEDQESRDDDEFHAEMLEVFRFARADEAASRTIPNATVTATLVARSGDPSIRPGARRSLSIAVE